MKIAWLLGLFASANANLCDTAVLFKNGTNDRVSDFFNIVHGSYITHDASPNNILIGTSPSCVNSVVSGVEQCLCTYSNGWSIA